MLACCRLTDGCEACASVPAGASTGAAEALELRDGDVSRYGGLGCRQAVAKIEGPLRDALRGQLFKTQADIDNAMIRLDGTPNKSNLGANSILAVSIAFARAHAKTTGAPLYHHFANLVGATPGALPRLAINLFSGGKHAGQQVAIQDVLIVPSASTIDGILSIAYDVYQAAARLILKRYGMRLLRADEGGLAPPCQTAEEMLALAMEAIEAAGYQPGSDVALAIDVASSHFYANGYYQIDGQSLTSAEMIAKIHDWVDRFPILSVEDGLDENDWENWPSLKRAIGDKALILGDDLLCTNQERIRWAIKTSCCNALLLKVNQVGTLTEAAAALRLARSAGWSVTISVRSGETEDAWAADLAVGWLGDQFKNGSITQSERLAKYNRLLAIEQQTKWRVREWPKH